MATIIQDRRFRGRERRGTPVKERAKKAGVALPPTPGGVRGAIDSSGTPETQRRARKQLQRHQKHCQQKVSRAEAAGDIEKWTRPAAKDAARKRRKKGEEKTVVRALICSGPFRPPSIGSSGVRYLVMTSRPVLIFSDRPIDFRVHGAG